jgi:hypothetical protein
MFIGFEIALENLQRIRFPCVFKRDLVYTQTLTLTTSQMTRLSKNWAILWLMLMSATCGWLTALAVVHVPSQPFQGIADQDFLDNIRYEMPTRRLKRSDTTSTNVSRASMRPLRLAVHYPTDLSKSLRIPVINEVRRGVLPLALLWWANVLKVNQVRVACAAVSSSNSLSYPAHSLLPGQGPPLF